MAKRDETFVHIAARLMLKRIGWRLIAGQYPGGSDDELHTLNVVDPTVARDDSPDPRRHAIGKFVPDLIAIQNNLLIIAEFKPTFDLNDELKLELLLSERRQDLYLALVDFGTRYSINELLTPTQLTPVPILGFLEQEYPARNDYGYIVVRSLDDAELTLPAGLENQDGT